MYLRPDKSYFKEPPELQSLVDTGKLAQMYLCKKADLNKILKLIQKKVLKEVHLLVSDKDFIYVLCNFIPLSPLADIAVLSKMEIGTNPANRAD